MEKTKPDKKVASKKLGELLVESGLITEDQLEEALEEGRENKGERIGAILVKKGYATEIDIAQTLAFQLNIQYIDISSINVDPEAIKLVSEELAKKYVIFPHYKQKKTLSVAMADPLNLQAIDDLRFSTGMEVRPSVATLKDITGAIERFYHLSDPDPIDEIMGDLQKDRLVEVVHESDSSRDLTEQIKKSAAPPIIKMVDSIIIHAVDNHASDIHIEPQETIVRLRLRVDGLMKETMQLPKWVQGPVVSRIKLMARMDIAERRIAQDGRLKVRIADRALDIRVSTLPTQYGETVVMRLLDPKAATISLETSGMLKGDLARTLDIIERPQGVVLVTGPTGSGKTSTLYGMISHIRSEVINIITIEDPIEYELKNVNQVAVNEKTGLTFAYTLRSVLRQDPDVILVGEMRDAETATIAHQASLTGHLVFTTLHTNDAISAVTRLKNMGLPSYIIASALNGVIAQRLVRVICAKCKESYTPSEEAVKKAGLKLAAGGRLYRGAGCKACGGTGYSGRTGIFEVLTVTNRLRKLIDSDASEQDISRAALDAGMTPLHMDGLKKVAAGITTLDELARVVYLSRQDESDIECPNCYGLFSEDTEECPNCGVRLRTECPTCSSPREAGWKACPFCATRFEEEAG